MPIPPRSLRPVLGSPADTLHRAHALVEALDPATVLWVGPDRGIARSQLRQHLGRSYDAVVLCLHDAVDADALGQAQGLVRGGGALVLRLGSEPLVDPRLAIEPFLADTVGTRFASRLHNACASWSEGGQLAPCPPIESGTPEQATVVRALVGALGGSSARAVSLTAHRGRGKSAALGLAAAQLVGPLHVAVTGPSADAVAEVRRFAPGIEYLAPQEALRAELDVLLVDEAAQLSVSMCKALATRHPRIAFATTLHGYEGTGQGFLVRLLPWLRERGLTELGLEAPIRWPLGDPLEQWVFDVLLLDEHLGPAPGGAPVHTVLSADRLGRDEPLLRQVWALLHEAHYRTTPSDLHRLLDAPNLRVHALLCNDVPVAVALVALEGSLPRPTCEALQAGSRRIRGQALADTLVCHAGEVEAGTWQLVRSVRLVTHPGRRREGLAHALVSAVEEAHEADLFGTVFGADPAVVQFRVAAGYQPIRLGGSAGARSGEPAVVMVKPRSERAYALVERLQCRLARQLDLQLDLLEAEGALLDRAPLASALRTALPRSTPWPGDERDAEVRAYTRGERPFEAVVGALLALVEERPEGLRRLPDRERAVVEGKVLQRRAWREVAYSIAEPSLPVAMRLCRSAVATLLG